MNAREWSLRIADLARRENCSLVDLLLALAEFDRLGVWRQLCVSNVPQLAKVLTEENRATVPAKFFHCSKQEARQVVAGILPAEVVPTRTVVTVVPHPARADPAPVSVQPVGRERTHPEGTRNDPGVRRTLVEPLTARETRMHVTVSPEFVALLEKAKAGESHRNPAATDGQVLTAALELLIAQQEKRRGALTETR